MNPLSWERRTPKEVLAHWKTSETTGLSEKEAAKRQSTYGRNELEHKKPESLFVSFLNQMKDFMIITLLIAALISFLVSYLQGQIDLVEPAIILAIVVLNAVLGVFQEARARRSLEALKELSAPLALCLRDGATKQIEASALVPGDIILLESGHLVPADARLLTSLSLSVEESALTGETHPVEKNVKSLSDKTPSLADKTNMVFAGTIVVGGSGTAVVTATGMQTELGRIADLISSETPPDTPLQKKLNHTGKLLGILALGICVLIFFLGILKKQPLLDMFMTSVSLGVAAIPESLPALVTIMLSLGVERMAKKNAVIRRLPAVETLGSATVICSDKTGTLTENKMTMTKSHSLVAPETLFEFFTLASHGRSPVEKAIYQYAAEQCFPVKIWKKDFPLIDEIPHCEFVCENRRAFAEIMPEERARPMEMPAHAEQVRVPHNLRADQNHQRVYRRSAHRCNRRAADAERRKAPMSADQQPVEENVGCDGHDRAVQRNANALRRAQKRAHRHRIHLKGIGEADNPQILNADFLNGCFIRVNAHDHVWEKQCRDCKQRRYRHHADQRNAIRAIDAVVILFAEILREKQHSAADEAPIARKHQR